MPKKEEVAIEEGATPEKAKPRVSLKLSPEGLASRQMAHAIKVAKYLEGG